MTALSIILFAMAGLLLVTAVASIYAREYPNWKYWWRHDDGSETMYPPSFDHSSTVIPPAAAVDATAETEPINAISGDYGEQVRRRTYPSDVFRYTIRRPTAATRRKMPDLGGFSEVPLRLYDQLGNRFTVHQKVRLN